MYVDIVKASCHLAVRFEDFQSLEQILKFLMHMKLRNTTNVGKRSASHESSKDLEILCDDRDKFTGEIGKPRSDSRYGQPNAGLEEGEVSSRFGSTPEAQTVTAGIYGKHRASGSSREATPFEATR